ncbi:MAG: hypothetical protein ACK4RG_09595 [Fimbriimonadales bacterium]
MYAFRGFVGVREREAVCAARLASLSVGFGRVRLCLWGLTLRDA